MEDLLPTGLWRRIAPVFRAPAHADPEEARSLRVSHLLSWAIILGVIPPFFLSLGGEFQVAESLLAVQFAAGLVAMSQVRRLRWRLANAILMFATLGVSVGLVLGSPHGVQDVATLTLPALVVLAALTMSSRGALVYTALVTLMVAILYGIEAAGLRLPTPPPPTEWADMIEAVIIVAVAGIATHLLADQLRRSIRSGRERGQALAVANATLQQESARLRTSEARLSSLVDASPDGIYQIDLRGTVQSCNRAGAELIGASAPGGVIGKNVLDVIAPEERALALVYFAQTVGEGIVRGIELTIHRLTEGALIAEFSAAVMRDAEGRPESLMVVARDATERRDSRARLERSNREQQVLLKEIHHRVKNNMQVISSLLSLQAAQMPDDRVRALFAESQNRVRSMALVHEKLYRSASLAEIDFGEYLESVVNELTRGHGRAQIVGRVSGRGIFLPIDTAIPCGLIVNELVSNALKHAFGGLPSGTVDVVIGRRDEEELELVVRDDGIGFPPNRPVSEESSMGLAIVTNLVAQIQGTLERGSGPGSEFRVRFPDPLTTKAGA
jgi:PAS domain S-box-containing protein